VYSRDHFDQLPKWLGVYITTRPEDSILEALEKKFKPLTLLPENENNLKDIRRYFTVLLKSIVADTGLSLETNAGEMKEGVETLVKKSNGLFIYASMAGEKLRSTFVESGGLTLQQVNEFPEGLEDFYKKQMLRICKAEHSKSNALNKDSWEWRTVELATAAREPLHYKTIQLLLGCEMSDIKRVVARLSRFFPIRDHCLHVYHKSVKDWLIDESRERKPMFVNLKTVNQIFAQRCWETLEGHRRQQQSVGASSLLASSVGESTWNYILKHGVAHLIGAGMKKEARTLVLDVGWLMARAGDGLGLVGDCRLFEGDRELCGVGVE